MKANWVYWHQETDGTGLRNLTSWWNSIQSDPMAKGYIYDAIHEGNQAEVAKNGYTLGKLARNYLAEDGKGVYFEWELEQDE